MIAAPNCAPQNGNDIIFKRSDRGHEMWKARQRPPRAITGHKVDKRVPPCIGAVTGSHFRNYNVSKNVADRLAKPVIESANHRGREWIVPLSRCGGPACKLIEKLGSAL